jgi:hypothetical protein
MVVESSHKKLDRERAGALSPYMGVITVLYFAAAIFLFAFAIWPGKDVLLTTVTKAAPSYHAPIPAEH